eukprot:4256952-Amphidinium_carterae.1
MEHRKSKASNMSAMLKCNFANAMAKLIIRIAEASSSRLRLPHGLGLMIVWHQQAHRITINCASPMVEHEWKQHHRSDVGLGSRFGDFGLQLDL